uniref:Uncharacterized protein n=1 Tax=Tetraselmis sp. GSL018 TaxID=582737 RepID=A0A061RLP5_9CHLO
MFCILQIILVLFVAVTSTQARAVPNVQDEFCGPLGLLGGFTRVDLSQNSTQTRAAHEAMLSAYNLMIKQVNTGTVL